jgi:hypothetical protein
MAATVAPRPSVERAPPSHVGFGAARKQTLHDLREIVPLGREVRDGEGVIASTRGLPWRYL